MCKPPSGNTVLVFVDRYSCARYSFLLLIINMLSRVPQSAIERRRIIIGVSNTYTSETKSDPSKWLTHARGGA